MEWICNIVYHERRCVTNIDIGRVLAEIVLIIV